VDVDELLIRPKLRPAEDAVTPVTVELTAELTAVELLL
jgi:hypothetical protein